MPKSYASTVVPASADQVWEYLRDFANLAEWHPGIGTCELEEGTTGVGCVRHLTSPDGAHFRERLTALDDDDRRYGYVFVESPFPVRRYRSTIRVAPVTDVGHAFVEWWGEFEADAADEEAMSRTFTRGVYGSGLKALRRRFGD